MKLYETFVFKSYEHCSKSYEQKIITLTVTVNYFIEFFFKYGIIKHLKKYLSL